MSELPASENIRAERHAGTLRRSFGSRSSEAVEITSGQLLRWGREQARTGAWRGEPDVAFLNPVPDAPLPSAEFVRRCLDVLAGRGFIRVVTGALSPLEQASFLSVGFNVQERLHLLGMDLGPDLPKLPPGLPLRRATPSRRSGALIVDREAFLPFWQFDQTGLEEALAATPRSRFKVATAGAEVVGYAICGRAGWRGFVQRLAVDPRRQREGTGRRLLIDGLRWMARRGVRRAVVNTQLGNEPALALYRRVGFRDERTGLSVLSAGLR